VSFRNAVQQTALLAGAFRPGLQALRSSDRRRVKADSQRLTGSVCLDQALKQACQNDPRWDYGIGYRESKQGNEMVCWLEVHPATQGEIKKVAEKLQWLKNWLSQQAPRLHAIKRRFVWIASGKVAISPRAPGLRKLAQKGLRFGGRRLKL